MGIREIWNDLEAVLVKCGFPVVDADDVVQGRRAVIRVTSIQTQQPTRGSIAAARVRLAFGMEVAITYETSNDLRVERKAAEDAEDVIYAIYTDVNLTNHHFTGASIDRDPARGVVTNTIRFDFQSEAAG